MDDNKSPQDILNEIFEKSQAAAPPPPEQPPGDDPPTAPTPGEPAEKHGTETAAKLLPWLCMALGAALLVLGVCLLQVAGMNRRLDGLQQAVEAVQSVDSLREENEQLQQENQELQKLLSQAEALNDHYGREIYDASTRQQITQIQRERAELLFYLGRFLDNREYEIAAVATIMEGEWLFQALKVNGEDVPINQTQMTQYNAYRKLLEEEGYIRPLDSDVRSDAYTFTDAYDLEENPDMYALNIVWEELYTYYVCDGYYSAAQLIVGWQGEGYEKKAGPYTAGLYEQLIQDMTGMGYLRVREDGGLDYGDALYPAVPVGVPQKTP